MSNDNGDNKVRTEHHEVLELADVKSEAWRDEQKIPEQRAETSEKKRRPPPKSHSGDYDCEQIEERDSPVTDVVKDRQGEPRHDTGDAKRDSKFLPRCASQTFLERFTFRLRAFFRRNHVNVDVAAISHEPAQGITLPKTEPACSERLPNDDLGYVVLARHTQKRFSNVPARRCNHLRSELTRQRDITSQPCLFVLRTWPRYFDVR